MRIFLVEVFKGIPLGLRWRSGTTRDALQCLAMPKDAIAQAFDGRWQIDALQVEAVEEPSMRNRCDTLWHYHSAPASSWTEEKRLHILVVKHTIHGTVSDIALRRMEGRQAMTGTEFSGATSILLRLWQSEKAIPPIFSTLAGTDTAVT